MKKTLSLVLSLLMILTTFTALPFNAFADTIISTVNLTYDSSAINLNTAYTEGEVDLRVRGNTDTEGEGYTISSSGLKYMPEDSWYGIGYGTEQVQSDRKYGIEYTLEVSDGFNWLDDVKAFASQTSITACPALTVNVNGVNRTDVTIEYNSYWNEVNIWVPIDFYEVHVHTNGWVSEGGNWYYYKDDVAATGWQAIGGKWYYFNADGVMQTGWVKSGNSWYYMSKSGAMVMGWQKVGSVWYYFNKSGAMATGWQKIGSVWYYFNGAGAMVTGWQKISGVWYYFRSSGAMQTGWAKISGSWYYFESSGKMLANTSKKIGSKTYKFNSSGQCTNP